MASGTISKPSALKYQQFEVNATRQLSSSMLACTLLFLTIRRYGYFDSVEIPTILITSGSITSGGCPLRYGNNTITVTISTAGLITLTGTGSDEVYVEVYGL